MPVRAPKPNAAIVERRGPRGHIGRLVLAGRATRSRGPRPGIEVRFPLYGCTLVTAGSGRYVDERHDVPLGRGSLVVVFPDHPHWYGADEEGWDEHFLAFDGPLFRLAAASGLIDVQRPVWRLADVDHFAARFEHVRRRPAATTDAGRDAEAALVLQLLAEMIDHAGRPPAATGGTDWLSRSIAMLESDLGRAMPPAAVAAAVGMSYDAWRRAFRARTGRSPARFRLDRRLDIAAERLTGTHQSTRAIAAELGFTDERHLTARFTERYGCTPARFRTAAHPVDRVDR
jgi:AraC-like DNA-binding protein